MKLGRFIICQVEIVFIRKMEQVGSEIDKERELFWKDLSEKMTLKQRPKEKKEQRCKYQGEECCKQGKQGRHRARVDGTWCV